MADNCHDHFLRVRTRLKFALATKELRGIKSLLQRTRTKDCQAGLACNDSWAGGWFRVCTSFIDGAVRLLILRGRGRLIFCYAIYKQDDSSWVSSLFVSSLSVLNHLSNGLFAFLPLFVARFLACLCSLLDLFGLFLFCF